MNNLLLNEELGIVPRKYIPQFRIIGSKYNILPDIYNILREENIEGHCFFDVFSGSAVVGSFFKKMFSIISNDNLYFSYVLQRALIVMNEYPSFLGLKFINLSRDPMQRLYQVLDYLNNLKGIKGFIYSHYTPASKDIDGVERRYFSMKNGMRIDAIRMRIEEWLENGYITEDEYFYLLACLLLAVQKVANTSGTYGAYNKFWDPRSFKDLTLKYIEVIPSKFNHIAYNNNIFDILSDITCDIAYIDPPYNSRQYITNYHVLETIAKYDNPEITGMTGIRKYKNEKSAFCSKVKVKDALFKLIYEIKAKYILLSYNSEGLLSKDQILQIFKDSDIEQVKVKVIPYRRFKSNNKTHNSIIGEYIFIGEKINA